MRQSAPSALADKPVTTSCTTGNIAEVPFIFQLPAISGLIMPRSPSCNSKRARLASSSAGYKTIRKAK